MNTRILIPLSLLLLLVLQSCCVGEPDRFYAIPTDAYTFIPYDANSSFRFQDSLGNVNFFTLELEQLDDRLEPDCPECCRNNYGEQYSIAFRGDNPAVAMRMSLTQEGYDGNAYPPVVRWEFYPDLRFEIPLEGTVCPTRSDVICHDSLAVMGHVYTNVMEFTAPYSVQGEVPQNVRLWYNKTEGILKYINTQGETWELLP